MDCRVSCKPLCLLISALTQGSCTCKSIKNKKEPGARGRGREGREGEELAQVQAMKPLAELKLIALGPLLGTDCMSGLLWSVWVVYYDICNRASLFGQGSKDITVSVWSDKLEPIWKLSHYKNLQAIYRMTHNSPIFCSAQRLPPLPDSSVTFLLMLWWPSFWLRNILCRANKYRSSGRLTPLSNYGEQGTQSNSHWSQRESFSIHSNRIWTRPLIVLALELGNKRPGPGIKSGSPAWSCHTRSMGQLRASFKEF